MHKTKQIFLISIFATLLLTSLTLAQVQVEITQVSECPPGNQISKKEGDIYVIYRCNDDGLKYEKIKSCYAGEEVRYSIEGYAECYKPFPIKTEVMIGIVSIIVLIISGIGLIYFLNKRSHK